MSFISFILIAPIAIYNAFVATCLWDWFVVPSFGLPHVSVGYMVGIFLLVRMVNARTVDTLDKDELEERMGKQVISQISSALFVTITWGFAFIVHLIVG